MDAAFVVFLVSCCICCCTISCLCCWSFGVVLFWLMSLFCMCCLRFVWGILALIVTESCLAHPQVGYAAALEGFCQARNTTSCSNHGGLWPESTWQRAATRHHGIWPTRACRSPNCLGNTLRKPWRTANPFTVKKSLSSISKIQQNDHIKYEIIKRCTSSPLSAASVHSCCCSSSSP